MLSGPGERLELAMARQAAYVRERPLDIDTDFLIDTFRQAARLPGLGGLYDPAHNPLFRLPLSGDGAHALLGFFRALVPETGELVHDFTDPEWNTRFLGDLYQDLSEDARKRYALLQTPDFVEEWILDRTLDPAMREFGATTVRMIDPACGSGHFLLGGFARVLAAWQREAPDMPPAAQAQKALDAVSGVDLNPFAVEIARFRLLLAALLAARETRLAGAPDFRFSLAVGDSLLHGRHFGKQRDLSEEMFEGFQRRLRHHYVSEDTAALDVILGRQYHAVVGNPPYITPKDPAMRDAYREIFVSCHRGYGLGAPFIERFFDLAMSSADRQAAGFVGVIVANSFMKREFGTKLIEEVLPRLDLTHVVDCSGAYIPGHATPTAILFGRNRPPVSSVVRTVRGIRGEPTAPVEAASGQVWSAIIAQTDCSESVSEFISSEDTLRTGLSQHPWSMGGGGAGDVQQVIEEAANRFLSDVATEIGRTTHTGEDAFFVVDRPSLLPEITVPIVLGENVRDYIIRPAVHTIFPYDVETGCVLQSIPESLSQHAWVHRTGLRARRDFGQNIEERGLAWFEHNMFPDYA
jgi:SAM-dependent methyltransferase